MQTFSCLIIRTSLFHLLNVRKTQSKKSKLNKRFEIVIFIRMTLLINFETFIALICTLKSKLYRWMKNKQNLFK